MPLVVVTTLSLHRGGAAALALLVWLHYHCGRQNCKNSPAIKGGERLLKSFKKLIKQISRDPEEDRRARERLFQDIVALAEWKRIPIATLFRRAGKNRQIYYKWKKLGRVPRRSTLFKLWDALELTPSDKARLAKKRILLSSESLSLWEGVDRATTVIRKTRLDSRRAVGRKIVELRRAKGMNQTELARAAGLSKGLVYKIETGRYSGDGVRYGSYLERLARALGANLEDL